MMCCQFWVPGIPVPQGSKNQSRSGYMYEANPALPAWRQDVVAAAQVAYAGQEPMLGPLRLEVQFSFPRPAAHYGTGRNAGILKASAPMWKASKPDGDKLLRAICDALTVAQVWRDDSQMASWLGMKWYAAMGQPPGVSVSVSNL